MGEFKPVVRSLEIQMQQTFSRKMFRYMMLIQPLVFGTILYLTYKNESGENYESYIIFGTGLISIWGTIIFSSASDIDRERRMGTLKYVLVSPTDFANVIYGKILGNVILGLCSSIYSILFLKICFHVEIQIANVLPFILSVIVTLFSFFTISMFLAAFFTLTRKARILMNFLEYPIYILCGLAFPLSILPKFTIPLSYILPPTIANKVLSISANGIVDFTEFYLYLFGLMFLSIIYFFT